MDSQTWNKAIASFPHPHLLQTWQWGEVKSKFGWEPIYKLWGNSSCPDGAALLLKRSIAIRGISLPISIIYSPKGPLLRDSNDADLLNMIMSDLISIARNNRAIFIKVDPDIITGQGNLHEEDVQISSSGKIFASRLEIDGWRISEDQIQFRNTVLVDLTPSEDAILSGMKQKTRYNIRLSKRKGVQIRVGTGEDYNLLYKMYSETAVRDGFPVRGFNYYRTLWDTFGSLNDNLSLEPSCEPLIAELDKVPIAAVVIFRFGQTAYYLQGMSRPIHRNSMPNYLLQWEAIKRSKAAGCVTYDLWGAPDKFNQNDPMWGVFRFKQGLGGAIRQTIGAYDYVQYPLIFKFYTLTLPKMLNVMRKFGMSRTEKSIESDF